MKKFTVFLSLATIALSSCVPSKKFSDVNSKYDKSQQQNARLKSDKIKLESDNADLSTRNEQLIAEVAQLVNDTTSLGAKLRVLNDSYKNQLMLNKELEKQLERILSDDANENRKLLSQLELNRLKLQKKEDELRRLENELNEKELKLNNLQVELEQREQRVNELEELLAKKDNALKELKEKIKKALAGFADKGFSIEEKNGKIYVRLDAKLLFPSGSTTIDPEGKKALVKLAQVLEMQSDLDVLVEGHTDADKFNSATSPKNNWELSVLRATSVVELMLDNSNMDATMVTAAGRSYFLPISNEDKALNRRIEIILQPKLDELYELLEK